MHPYLIDTHWLKDGEISVYVGLTKKALQIGAVVVGLLLGIGLGVLMQSIGLVFFVFLLFVGIGTVVGRYVYRRKPKGYIRFTEQHIYFKEIQTQRVDLNQIAPVHIDFNFDESMSHRLWLPQVGGERKPVLFEFIKEAGVRKFRHWLYVLAQQGIAIAPQTRETLSMLPLHAKTAETDGVSEWAEASIDVID